MRLWGLDRIYRALNDEISRYFFIQRLMYSISNDRKYIRDMVGHEIELYSDVDQMYRLIHWIKSVKKRVVLFGAGFVGYQIIEILSEKGIDVDYICDNNDAIWGKEKYGRQVMPPSKLVNDLDVAVIIGVNLWRNDVFNQLISLGVSENNVFFPKKDWWLGKYDQYYDLDILHPCKNEVFVDGGALDGLDSYRFAKWCGGNYSDIFAFEPDPDNYEKLKAAIGGLTNVSTYNRGLWDCDTVLRFNSGDKANSAVSEDGDIEIQTMAIDDIQSKNPISYIKLDVEGCEGKALDGARNAIMEYKPKLAICVYHKPEDIIELPLKVLDMVPEYKLYLRHYSYVDTETVMYAIV